jgi:serine phosphatase RsbU (regulator of sigma subunit)/tetratricopeptide (TPR) repeat protein
MLCPIFSYALPKSDNDVERIKAEQYLKRANAINFDKSDSIFFYANKALTIAENLNIDSLKFEAYNILAYAHYVTHRTSEGIANGMEALKIAKRLQKPKWLAKVSNHLGLLYQNAKKFGESIILFEQAIEIYGANEYSIENGNLHNNIANSYLELNDFTSALKFRKKAIDIRTSINDMSGLGDAYNDIGETFIKLEEYDSALFYLDKASIIKVELGDVEMQSLIKINSGITYMRKKNWDKAINLFNDAEIMAKRIKAVSFVRDIYLNKSICYKNLNQLQAAYHFLNMHRISNDSVYLLENKRQLNELNEQFQTQKKSIEIDNLKKEKQQSEVISNEKDLRKNIVIIFSLLFLLATGFFSRWMYKRFKLTSAQKEIIQKQKHDVDEKNKSITDSINYAKRIQEAMLPEQKLRERLFPESFVLFLPKDIVSGDFFWFAERDQLVYAAVVDCTGHGVPGAFMSMIGNAFLNEIVNNLAIMEPAAILNELKRKVIQTLKQSELDSNSRDGMDIALICYNKETQGITFAGANNPVWVVSNIGGEATLVEIKGSKQPIGFHHVTAPFDNHTINCKVGDILYLLSDGYADQFGGELGKKFKYKPLKDHLISYSAQTMSAQRKALHQTFHQWKGNLEQVDDVLIIGIKIS